MSAPDKLRGVGYDVSTKVQFGLLELNHGMNITPDAHPTLIVEAEPKIFGAPRTLLAEQFCDWLVREGCIPDLPAAEIVVTITPTKRISFPYGTKGAVGSCVTWLGYEPNDRWEVAVAYGEEYSDEADVVAWLTTIPHELLHLADFAKAFGGRLPNEVSSRELVNFGNRSTGPDDESRIENLARRISARFDLTHPNACASDALLTGVDSILQEAKQNRKPRKGREYHG